MVNMVQLRRHIEFIGKIYVKILEEVQVPEILKNDTS